MNYELRYKVFVWCNTYNQASYIKDTMDGFCMQQTNFPFVCMIMDDASTDVAIRRTKTAILRFIC